MSSSHLTELRSRSRHTGDAPDEFLLAAATQTSETSQAAPDTNSIDACLKRREGSPSGRADLGFHSAVLNSIRYLRPFR